MAITIQNGRGLTRVDQYPQAMEPGVPQGDGHDVPWENSDLAQISTTTWSAAADVSDEIVAGQVIRTTLTDPDGVAYATTNTVTAADNTAGTDGAGLAYMAGRLAVEIEANGELVNIVSASAAAAVVTICCGPKEPLPRLRYQAISSSRVDEARTSRIPSPSRSAVAIDVGRSAAPVIDCCDEKSACPRIGPAESATRRGNRSCCITVEYILLSPA
jgi:hypothetical protein